MFNISGLLDRIPDEYKPMAAFAIGAFILVIIVLVHGAGLHNILVLQKRIERRLRLERPRVVAALILFGGTVFLMLALHLSEVAIWAFFLTHMGLVAHASDAIYFSANAYTTLGYGNVDLGQHWRNISPIMGISGLFTFAWSTSSLVAVVALHRQLIEQLEEEREHELRMRFGLKKDEWNSLKKARDAERSEREKARAQAAGTSSSQQDQIWNDEKNREAEIRKSAVEEVKELRAKERSEEENLGKDFVPKGSADQK